MTPSTIKVGILTVDPYTMICPYYEVAIIVTFSFLSTLGSHSFLPWTSSYSVLLIFHRLSQNPFNMYVFSFESGSDPAMTCRIIIDVRAHQVFQGIDGKEDPKFLPWFRASIVLQKGLFIGHPSPWQDFHGIQTTSLGRLGSLIIPLNPAPWIVKDLAELAESSTSFIRWRLCPS